MDIRSAAATGTAAVPWLVLGVVVGVGLVLLVGAATALALRRRPGAAPSDPAAGDDGGDDLPGFLEFPPGSAPVAPTGWTSLAPPPAPPTAPPARRRRDTAVPLAAMALTALLLLGAAAAAAASSRPDARPAPGGPAATPPEASAPAARLTFGGVVLEPRAVGVTATYPLVEISTDDGRTVARLQFPTYNCLTAEAPADPVAAGCVPALAEYAELRSPDLAVRRDGDGFAVTGRFPTKTRPNGSPPAATGRVYALRITATPAGGPAAGGWRPARGTLELGTGRATTLDRPGLDVIRSGS